MGGLIFAFAFSRRTPFVKVSRGGGEKKNPKALYLRFINWLGSVRVNNSLTLRGTHSHLAGGHHLLGLCHRLLVLAELHLVHLVPKLCTAMGQRNRRGGKAKGAGVNLPVASTIIRVGFSPQPRHALTRARAYRP